MTGRLQGEEAIQCTLFARRLEAIAEEMGEVLTRTGFSPNIKERRDHSCALFDARGQTVAQAAHIPVHLGAAPACVQAVQAALHLGAGEVAIVNDPYAGGTHLPDITLVQALSLTGGEAPELFLATRAHHADVGGITPGSLPPSRHIDEEGWRCPPVRLDDAVVASLLAASRTPQERRGDLRAQQATLEVGRRRVEALAARWGADAVLHWAHRLQDHAEAWAGEVFTAWGEHDLRVEDWLDDARGDGPPVGVRLRLQVRGGRIVADFSATDDQVEGPMNAPRAIVESAVLYALLCHLPEGFPANGGLMRRVEVVTRPGSLVDPRWPAPVAAGNVETSQRLVDVLLQALSQISTPVAASQGTMNNTLLGSPDGVAPAWVVYETVGGGHGGGAAGPGAHAMQAHMTNTRNTPIEALEHAVPLRVVRLQVRHGSGGAGRHPGGDGMVRAWQALAPTVVTWITERRRQGPPGLEGGHDGAPGRQWVDTPGGDRVPLPSKGTRLLQAGDIFVLETPGGGGWGPPAT
jgi:N-methylhydantoinase B